MRRLFDAMLLPVVALALVVLAMLARRRPPTEGAPQ